MDPSDHDQNELGRGTAGGDDRSTHANGTPGKDGWWLRSVVEHSSEIVTVVDPDGTLRYASPAFGRVLGHDPDEAIGTNVLDYVHPHDLPRVLEEIEKAMAEGGVASNVAEYRFRRKDDSWRWMESVGIYLLNDPAVRGVVVVSRDVTERREAEELLRRSETSLAESQRIAHLGTWERNLRTDESWWSAETYRIYGFDPEPHAPPLRELMEVIYPEDRDQVEAAMRGALVEAQPYDVEHRIVLSNEEVRWVHRRAEVVRGTDGKPLRIAGTVHDITERKEAEEAAHRSEERLRSLADAAFEGILISDGGQILEANRALTDMFGYSPSEVVGRSTLEFVAPEHRGLVRRKIASGDEEPYEAAGVRKDGTRIDLEVRGGAFSYRGRRVRVTAVRDVTEKKQSEQRLHYLAFHDSLTGLPNRRLFVDRLGHALERIRRQKGQAVAVLFMDLDGFKVVNDSLGHVMGDRLLVEVAGRLKGCLRPEDTLARFGGDEFTVLIEDLEVPDGAVRVAERIVEELREPFTLDGRELYAAASIGVALGRGGTRDPDELLREADTAMYRAKEAGSGYEVFDPAMHERAVNRLELENDLRRAIEEDEFVVHYQPIVSFQTGELWGMEALVRWEHPERGLLNPDEFVPVAEESGLVVPMGEMVLEEACRRAVEWQRKFPLNPPLAMSVNFSGRQLRRPDLHEVIGQALAETGLPASSLGLDITETVYIGALDANTAALDRLRALGIRISLDDFGSGYSSLSYLKRLPADILKIDRSFTRGLGLEAEDTAIVQTVVDLAHILGMEVVAEGVEIEEQETLLREMGCDFGQGYHFSRPLPPEAASELLSSAFRDLSQRDGSDSLSDS